MPNILPLIGALAGAANQGDMKTQLRNQRDFISMLPGGALFEAVSPAAFTLTSSVLAVNNQYNVGGYIDVSRAPGSGAFNLDGITASNFAPGQWLAVGTQASRPMTIRHQRSAVTNGQILLRGGTDVTLNDRESVVLLRLEAQTGPWREMLRSGSAGGAGGGFGSFNFRQVTLNANYEKPADLSAAIVVVVGGGGGGAGKPRTNSSALTLASGGGAAGGWAVKFFNETDLPNTCAMTIGAGGAGGTDTTIYTRGNQGRAYALGANGGSSTFSGTGITSITCAGGEGGAAFVRGRTGIGLVTSVNDSAIGGPASGGDINVRGNSGTPGIALDIDDNSVRKHNELGGRGGSSPFAPEPEVIYNGNAKAYATNEFGAGGNAPTGGSDTFSLSYSGAAGAPGVIFIIEVKN